MAITLCRLALMARASDMYHCPEWRYSDGDTTGFSRDKVLWLKLKRKKRVKFHWEPIVPCHDKTICPVRWFLAYIRLGQYLSTSWESDFNAAYLQYVKDVTGNVEVKKVRFPCIFRSSQTETCRAYNRS